ncbi:putative G-protein coupled receptor 139 [Mustelus asterias]
MTERFWRWPVNRLCSARVGAKPTFIINLRNCFSVFARLNYNSNIEYLVGYSGSKIKRITFPYFAFMVCKDSWSTLSRNGSGTKHISRVNEVLKKSPRVTGGSHLPSEQKTVCEPHPEHGYFHTRCVSENSNWNQLTAQYNVNNSCLLYPSLMPKLQSTRVCCHLLAAIQNRSRAEEIHMKVNIVAIVILSRGKCGLSNCTTHYLVAMATVDLLVIIFEIVLFRIKYYYFPMSFLDITPVCSVIIVLFRAATDCSVWFTVTFSFDRFVAICCQKLSTKYCNEKAAAVVLATTGILLCSKNIPFYFSNAPGEIIDKVPWFCTARPSYYTEPGWVGFDWLDTVLTPLLPFALILLLNALTVRHIVVVSQVRKGLRGQNSGGNCSDPEMQGRRKSMILLFSISGTFILLWTVYVMEFLYYSIRGESPEGYNESEGLFLQVGYLLVNVNCCTNTFIYGVTQSKFRQQVKSAMKYPVASIIQLINKQV